MTLRSLPEIGRRFGGRDQPPCLHAVRKIEHLQEIDATLADEIEIAEARTSGVTWDWADMKVTVERADLLKSLSHVHRVVERRNTILILANVLVRAEKAKLSFR